jgi:hypothetical protein
MLEHATVPARRADGWQGLVGRHGEDYLSLIALGGGVCFGVIAVGMLLLVAIGVLPR